MNQKPFSQDMNSKIVDSHCHLDFKDFDNDRDEVIKNAKLNNVDFLLSISVNLENFNNVHKIAKNNKNIWCTTGIHPNNVEKELSSTRLEEIQNSLIFNLENEKVIGVGETGLDFFKNNLNKKIKLKVLIFTYRYLEKKSFQQLFICEKQKKIQTFVSLKP